MPTAKEMEDKRVSHARFIRLLMQRKEEEAVQRLALLRDRVPKLKPRWEKYLEEYKTHIKPLMADVNEYWDSLNEITKLEHFLQGQAAFHATEQKTPSCCEPLMHGITTVHDPKNCPCYCHRGVDRSILPLPPQVQKLPYADKSQVGRKPKKEVALDDAAAKSYMDQLKKMDPKLLAELLKSVGGGK